MGLLNLFLLCFPFTIPIFVVAGWLTANATAAFARSRVSWIASALLLPHFASKLMDAGYDAVLAGNLPYAALLVGALLLVIAGLSSLMNAGR